MKYLRKPLFFVGLCMALTFGLSIIPSTADAWAINCGCRKLKKALKADGEYSLEDAAKVAECHGGFTVKVCINF